MIKFKRGDTFRFTGNVTRKENNVQVRDFTGWTVRSHLRIEAVNHNSNRKGELIEVLTPFWLNASQGLLCLESQDTTQDWPICTAAVDLEFTSPAGDVITSETAILQIIQGPTQ